MRGHCLVTIVVSLVGVILAGGPVVRADEQDFLDYINDRPTFREHHSWAIFFGTGWTQEDLKHIQEWEREGKWINPFTEQPFDKVKVFVFGQDNPVLEALRVVSDHLEVHVLSSWKELEGYHFDFAICHSNGCTNTIDAHKSGIMRVDTFLSLGTDWTSKNFRPGDLKGAELYFFATKGDPIWKIPAPDWARITEDTPGLSFSVPGDNPWEIVKGMGNLLTRGRADPDRFPVIRLDAPPGQEGTLSKPFRPHGIVASYFQALDQWMKAGGKLQKALAEKIRQVEASLSDDQKKIISVPPGGGGPGGMGSSSQSPGGGILPSVPGADRGGVYPEIRITPQDFQSK